jgi:hypothetical protein
MRTLKIVEAVLCFSLMSALVDAADSVNRGALTAPPSSGPDVVSSAAPKVFGISMTAYQTIGYTEFSRLSSNLGYASTLITAGIDGRYPTEADPASGFGFLAATLHLPSGAILESLEFDGCDSSSSGQIGLNLEVEDKSGNVQGTTIFVASTGESQTPGCVNLVVDVSSLNLTIDNNAGRLVPVVFADKYDGTVSFSGVVVGYRLRVSPPPGTATFNDVPTSDFGFQFVEAFAAAGITVGCTSDPPFTPPVYCPDRNVTRREMAIFFAKALGLQFQ